MLSIHPIPDLGHYLLQLSECLGPSNLQPMVHDAPDILDRGEIWRIGGPVLLGDEEEFFLAEELLGDLSGVWPGPILLQPTYP